MGHLLLVVQSEQKLKREKFIPGHTATADIRSTDCFAGANAIRATPRLHRDAQCNDNLAVLTRNTGAAKNF
jgi:hypothetical protein